MIRLSIAELQRCWCGYVTWPCDLDLRPIDLDSGQTWLVIWSTPPPSLKILRLSILDLWVNNAFGATACVCDGLLQRLHKSKVGCWVGNVYVGALAYADDVTLLAPTNWAMHFLLQISEQYGWEFSIVFNAE